MCVCVCVKFVYLIDTCVYTSVQELRCTIDAFVREFNGKKNACEPSSCVQTVPTTTSGSLCGKK